MLLHCAFMVDLSQVKGEQGIAGPYRDVGPILDQEDLGGFDPDVDVWEGDHGCDVRRTARQMCHTYVTLLCALADWWCVGCLVLRTLARQMFFPFQLDDGSWLALFGSELGRFPHFNRTRQVGLAKFTPSSAPLTECRLIEQISAEACVEGVNFGCNTTTNTLWAKGCRGKFQCGRSTLSCGGGSPPHAPSCELSCEAGGFAGNWTRLSEVGAANHDHVPIHSFLPWTPILD